MNVVMSSLTEKLEQAKSSKEKLDSVFNSIKNFYREQFQNQNEEKPFVAFKSFAEKCEQMGFRNSNLEDYIEVYCHAHPQAQADVKCFNGIPSSVFIKDEDRKEAVKKANNGGFNSLAPNQLSSLNSLLNQPPFDFIKNFYREQFQGQKKPGSFVDFESFAKQCKEAGLENPDLGDYIEVYLYAHPQALMNGGRRFDLIPSSVFIEDKNQKEEALEIVTQGMFNLLVEGKERILKLSKKSDKSELSKSLESLESLAFYIAQENFEDVYANFIQNTSLEKAIISFSSKFYKIIFNQDGQVQPRFIKAIQNAYNNPANQKKEDLKTEDLSKDLAKACTIGYFSPLVEDSATLPAIVKILSKNQDKQKLWKYGNGPDTIRQLLTIAIKIPAYKKDLLSTVKEVCNQDEIRDNNLIRLKLQSKIAASQSRQKISAINSAITGIVAAVVITGAALLAAGVVVAAPIVLPVVIGIGVLAAIVSLGSFIANRIFNKKAKTAQNNLLKTQKATDLIKPQVNNQVISPVFESLKKQVTKQQQTTINLANTTQQNDVEIPQQIDDQKLRLK